MQNNNCPFQPGTRVWAYLRNSSEQQAERGTIASQRGEIKDYAKQQGLVLEKAFEDEGVSGTSTKKREAFLRMLEEAKVERPAGILISDWSRFGRNFDELQESLIPLKKLGVIVWPIQGGFASGNSIVDKLVSTNLQIFAELENTIRAAKVKAGMHTLAKAGYRPTGFAPVGYKMETQEADIEGKRRRVRTLIPDPEKSRQVGMAFQLKAKGSGNSEIIAKTGLCKSNYVVSRILRSRVYLGELHFGDTTIPLAHEPLVDPVTFQKAQEIMDSRSRLVGTLRMWQSTFLLYGLVFCGRCGKRLKGHSHVRKNGGKPWRGYRCYGRQHDSHSCDAKMVRADKLDNAILGVVLDRILTPDHLWPLYELTQKAINARLNKSGEEAKSLENQIADLDKKISRLVVAVEDGGYERVKARLKELEGERNTLLSRLVALRRQEKASLTISPQAFQKALNTIRQPLLGNQLRQQQKALGSFVKKIEVNKEGGRIYYGCPSVTTSSKTVGLRIIRPAPLVVQRSWGSFLAKA